MGYPLVQASVSLSLLHPSSEVWGFHPSGLQSVSTEVHLPSSHRTFNARMAQQKYLKLYPLTLHPQSASHIILFLPHSTSLVWGGLGVVCLLVGFLGLLVGFWGYLVGFWGYLVWFLGLVYGWFFFATSNTEIGWFQLKCLPLVWIDTNVRRRDCAATRWKWKSYQGEEQQLLATHFSFVHFCAWGILIILWSSCWLINCW